MKTEKLIAHLALIGLLLVGIVSLSGCKQEPEAAQTETAQTDVEQPVVVATETEQTTCPVMGGAIDKDVFVEYEGKKVYFCCEPCKGKFDAAPATYVAKLPQFNQVP
jgi:YHS domain-containing protein